MNSGLTRRPASDWCGRLEGVLRGAEGLMQRVFAKLSYRATARLFVYG